MESGMSANYTGQISLRANVQLGIHSLPVMVLNSMSPYQGLVQGKTDD